MAMGYQNVTIHIIAAVKGSQRQHLRCHPGAAAATHVPKPLIEQLAEEGRLVIPVGNTSIR